MYFIKKIINFLSTYMYVTLGLLGLADLIPFGLLALKDFYYIIWLSNLLTMRYLMTFIPEALRVHYIR